MESQIWHKLNLSTKEKHEHREQTCSCQGGGREGVGWTGIGIYTLLYTENQSVTRTYSYSLGKSIQYNVIAYMGKESEKEWRYMYMHG